jgi:hypothetical protein
VKKVFMLSLAVIFGFGLVMGYAQTETKHANEKEALKMTNSEKKPKKSKWIKIRIDFESGEIEDVKAHDPGGSEQQLTQEELDQLLQGPHQYIGKLVHTHSSPGCVTYILGGWARKICF